MIDFFSKRKSLPTTSKLAPMSANTAIHMVASPAKVSTKNTALMPKARAMLCLRVRDVAYNRRLICANGKTGGLRQSLSA
jgi:hypothetical protein